jgi:hypothetical protein
MMALFRIMEKTGEQSGLSGKKCQSTTKKFRNNRQISFDKLCPVWVGFIVKHIA